MKNKNKNRGWKHYAIKNLPWYYIWITGGVLNNALKKYVNKINN